jgi:hypothetical protein
LNRILHLYPHDDFHVDCRIHLEQDVSDMSTCCHHFRVYFLIHLE